MNSKLPKDYCNLEFNKTITRWDEAIPLGNGLCGALIWGNSDGLRFSLDRGDIWDTTPFEGIKKEEFSYPMMVKLAREGNIDEIRRIFDAPYNQVLPSKLPAGKLIFDFGTEENVCSKLDLSCAEAEIRIGEDICLHAFLHAERKAGCIRINRPLEAFSYRIENPEYGTEDTVEEKTGDSVNTSSLKSLVYKKPEIVQEGNISYFVQEISETFSYGIFTQAKEKDGVTEITYFVAASNDGADWKEKAVKLLEDSLEDGYDKMKESHVQWWSEFWAKSSMTIPDKFFEKNWYLTQYLLASCSRKGCYPMPLQGVWTADDGSLPPWKGDYHLDLNVQMSYYSYLKANHLEEGESVLDYLCDMADCGREFARSFYQTDGLCLPSTMTLNGDPLGGWGMYSLSPTNQLWLCHMFKRYYQYTGDRTFMEEKAYPYLRESAECILGLLEEKDGKYVLPISSSPEIHDDSLESFVTPNSNYDLALMRGLFEMLTELAEELENGEDARWRVIHEKLPELSVNSRGVLMLSPDEELKESHRHFSHAMSIYPLRLIPYEGEENRRIIDATINQLECLGTGFWVGYTFGWMAELYAIQRNGNGAAWQLATFWKHTCSQNGFHLNGDYKKYGTSAFHYRPFTLEGNFLAADALQEMMMQSENNVIDIFPAIPEDWLKGTVSFEDLRGERGILVSASMTDGEITSVVLKPQYSGKILLRKKNGECVEMELKGGREYTI